MRTSEAGPVVRCSRGEVTDLVDGVSDGVVVLPLHPQPPSLLLHQSHYDGSVPVLVILVRVHNGHPELGVGPERVCHKPQSRHCQKVTQTTVKSPPEGDTNHSEVTTRR